MNFGTTWWVKPLLMVVAILAAFGAGMVVEANLTTDRILKAGQLEREKLASTMAAKMREMTAAAVKSAEVRSARELELEGKLKEAQEEAISHASNNVGLPAGSVRAINRLRKPANSGTGAVQPAK